VLLEMIDPVLGCVPRYYAPTTCAEVLLSPFGQGSPSGAGWSNAPLNPLVRPTVRRFDFADWSNPMNESAEVQWLVYNCDPDLDELYILQLAMMPSRITWTSAVPEPSAWVMMIMGFAGVGIAMRRRRGHREAAPDPAARISHGDTPTGSQGIA
jgi:hypothetical protein